MAAPTFVASGTATSNSTASITPDWPAGLAAGDYVILEVVHKYEDRTVSNPSGFTLLGSHTGGAGTAGVDTGNLKILVYGKEADGTESGTFTVSTTGGTASCLFGRTYALRKAGGTTWSVGTAAIGADNSPGTLCSFTFDTDPGIVADDLCCVAWAVNSDAYTHGTHTFAATGLTVGTVSSRGNAAVTAGNNLRAGLVTAPITAGPATDVATYTNTASSSGASAPAGAAILLRLREIPASGTALPIFMHNYRQRRSA